MTIFRFLAIIVLSILFSSCGGGAGSGSSSSDSNKITISPTTVTFKSQVGQSKIFSVVATAADPSILYGEKTIIAKVVDPKGVLISGFASYVSMEGNSMKIYLETTPTLARGNYQGSFQLFACTNTPCTSQLPGSPWTINYNFDVQDLLAAKINTNSLTQGFNSQEKATVNVDVYGAELQWSVKTDVPWLQSRVSSGSGIANLQIDIASNSLTVGKHIGNIIISSSDGQTISKSFTLTIVPEVQLFVQSFDPTKFIANAGTNPPGFSYFVGAKSDYSWTLTSSSSWLVPRSASGKFPGWAEFDFQSASLAPGDYTAAATLTASDGQTATFPVSLKVYEATTPLVNRYAGQNTRAEFMSPTSIIADSRGNLYVGDSRTNTSSVPRIRKVSTSGSVTTFFESAVYPASPWLGEPTSLAMDSAGNLYVSGDSKIFKIAPDGTYTVPTSKFDFVQLGSIQGMAIDVEGNIYFSDSYNYRIAKLANNGEISTIASTGRSSLNPATNSSPKGLTLDSNGNIIVVDQANCTIKKITPGGQVTVLAGQAGVCGYSDGPAASAAFNHPTGIVKNSKGEYYIADTYNCLIRKLNAQGIVSTVAGTINNCNLKVGPLPSSLDNVTALALVGSTLYFSSSSGFINVITNVP